MTAAGFVPAYEDESLSADTIIYRAVNTQFVDWVADLDNRGMPPLKSQAFQSRQPPGYEQPAMSVALSHILEALGEPPERALKRFDETYGIAAFTVGQLRAIRPRLGVCSDPLDDAPWHGLVFGLERKDIKKQEKYGLLKAAVLIKSPVR